MSLLLEIALIWGVVWGVVSGAVVLACMLDTWEYMGWKDKAWHILAVGVCWLPAALVIADVIHKVVG